LQGKRESISPEQKAQVQGKQLDRSQVGKQSSTNRLNEIFRPGREAANAAKVIIRGVKTLVALEEKAGGAGHLVAAENAGRFRFKAFLNFEPLIHKEEK